MLTCSMCGHSGEDVHMYEYVGSVMLTPECDDLEECFKRGLESWKERRSIVERSGAEKE